MNIPKTVAAFALALLAAPLVHARIPFPPAGSLRINAPTHSREGSPSNAQSTQHKTIKDPGEYNAYIAALNTQDPAARAAAMEAFIKQYPLSVVLTDALEQAMAAYQQANKQDKLVEIARRIVAPDAGNIRALAIITFIDRAVATQGGPNAQSALKESCPYAEIGLQRLPSWPRPEDVSDADFEKLKSQMADIFYGAKGFCALQARDYPAAREVFTRAFQIDPTNLQDVYQLGIAALEMDPIDVNGFWYLAKAFNLAQGNAPAQKGIRDYAKAKYKTYHGGEDGWDQIVSAAANQSAPPAGFAQSIKPKPTPAELAVNAVKENKPGTLSISDWEYILSYRDASPANKEAAGKVWKLIQDSNNLLDGKMQIPVKVISATKETITAAITDENQEANRADLEITMEKPMLHPPAAGTFVNIKGYIVDYTLNPFLFTMKQGEQDLFDENVKDIYFDFGNYDLRSESQQALGHAARVISENPDWIVQVEGNCDERESIEYPGIALKRAEAARDALIQGGVNLRQLKSVSKGNDKPVCREANDDCAQRNRRDHFALLPKN